MFSTGYESVDGQKVFDLVGNEKYANISQTPTKNRLNERKWARLKSKKRKGESERSECWPT